MISDETPLAQRSDGPPIGSTGSPIDADTRHLMERRFGHSFGDVRVHTDRSADAAARSIDARAYAVGRDLVFAAGEYAPGTDAGRRVLAHELAHVVQHRRSPERVIHRLGNLAQRPAGLTCPVPPGRPPSALVDIFFANNVSALTPTDHQNISHFADGWHAQGGSTPVRVDGFASENGPDALNWNLSCQRAENVRASLLAPVPLGTGPAPAPVPMASISHFAHGETTDFDAANHAPNRRVTLHTGTPVAPSAPTPPAGCVAPTNPNRWGRADNPTTGSEAGEAASHPIDAVRANGAADDAIAIASRSGLAGPHLGPFDAMRHCTWNCLMTQRIGAVAAERHATAHENSNPSPIPNDDNMDLHNNVIGRTLGVPGANCETACRGAVAGGLLRTIRQPPAVAAACIGASSQPWP